MVLHTNLPQSLGRSMIAKFEANGGFKLFEFARPQFDEKAVPFDGDFKDFPSALVLVLNDEHRPSIELVLFL